MNIDNIPEDFWEYTSDPRHPFYREMEDCCSECGSDDVEVVLGSRGRVETIICNRCGYRQEEEV